MNWHNVLMRPSNLYEELLRRKLISGGSAHEETSTTGVFETDISRPLRKLLLTMNPIQSGSGDPSPTNIRPITGWTGVNVARTGKNLYDCAEFSSYKQADGTYRLTGADATTAKVYFPENLVGKEIVISVYLDLTKETGPSYIRLRAVIGGASINGATVNNNNDGYSTVTVTPTSTSDCFYMTYGSNGSNYYTFSQFQVELKTGSGRTDYEPYQVQTYPVSWQTEAGTIYGGTLDIVSGVLTVEYASLTFDGTQEIGNVNWRPNTNSRGWLYKQNVTPNIITEQLDSTNLSNIKSDRLKTIRYSGNSGIYGNDESCISAVGGTTYGVAMRVEDTSLTTVNAVNAWLAQNPVQVVYKLATPQTYQLTPQKITTLVGTNVITSDADVTEVVYLTRQQSQSLLMSSPLSMSNTVQEQSSEDPQELSETETDTV